MRYEAETMTALDGTATVVGREYGVAELVAEAASDVLFYDQSGGGVTLSGGEAMAQDFGYIQDLVTALAAKGLSVAVDTSGVAPGERFEALAPRVDWWLYDLKFIDPSQHRRWTGKDNRLVLGNLELLGRLGARIQLRLILLEGLNTDEAAIDRTLAWLKAHAIPVAEVNLLPYHRFGLDKQAQLGRTPREFTAPTPKTMARIEAQVKAAYDRVTIGG
jgi:pyruvate formate lyase activating enzyme